MKPDDTVIAGRRGDIPLKEVSITGRVVGEQGEISVRQLYKNEGSVEIEAIYTFPLPGEAAVTGFSAKIGATTIQGDIQEKDRAYEDYHQALMQGNSAFLLEEHRPNLFQVSLGRLKPGETALVEISYLDSLEKRDREMTLRIPTVTAPMYIPGEENGEIIGPGTSCPTDRVPDADFITPPLGDAPYRVTFDLELEFLRPVKSIESPSHKIRLENLSQNRFRVTQSGTGEKMDRDFVLHVIFTGEPSARGTIFQDQEAHGFIYLTFVPEIPPQSQDEGKNFFFLVDVSGSMSGEKLEEAKNALLICLRNLTEKDQFNLIAFESDLHPFSGETLVPFNQEKLDHASRWIKGLEPLGGTEVLPAIQRALNQCDHNSVILLFTDGQVGNEQEVINYVWEHIGAGRLFSFGIDTAVNSWFINELAAAGNGRSEFVRPGERIDDKVVRQFARIVSPRLDKAWIDWGGLNVGEFLPEKLGSIYDFEELTVLAPFSGRPEGDISLVGKIGGEEFRWPVSLKGLKPCRGQALLEKIWARQKIKKLEQYLGNINRRREKTIKEEIIDISRRYRIISSLTSFVAVYKRKDGAGGPLITQVVPVSPPEGWEGSFLVRENVYYSFMVDLNASPSSPIVTEDTSQIRFSLKKPSIKALSHKKAPERAAGRGGFSPGKAGEVARAELLREIAARQMADGSFGENSSDGLLLRTEMTADALTAFLLGKEDITLYKNQLLKSVERLICLAAEVQKNNPKGAGKIRVLEKVFLALGLFLGWERPGKSLTDAAGVCLESLSGVSQNMLDSFAGGLLKTNQEMIIKVTGADPKKKDALERKYRLGNCSLQEIIELAIIKASFSS